MNIKEIDSEVKKFTNYTLKESIKKYHQDKVLGVKESILEKISKKVIKNWKELPKERLIKFYQRLERKKEYEFRVLRLLILKDMYEFSKNKENSWMGCFITGKIDLLKRKNHSSTEYEIKLFRKLKKLSNLCKNDKEKVEKIKVKTEKKTKKEESKTEN